LELFGLSVRVYPMLPEEVAAARETGEIQRFPRDQYSPAVELYPRRIAILEFSEAEEAGFPTL
jgi:hypothetical protein